MDDARGGTRTALMPVMRYENFTDKTGDVEIDKLMIPVGNQTARTAARCRTSACASFSAAPGQFMTLPNKGTIKGGSLLAQRDRHALVSAQATFLPIPQEGKATFWPVIFNYQSTKKNPAVLTLLVTRQGTSVTIVDNARDTIGGDTWGQRLFFNKNGTARAADGRAPVRREGFRRHDERRSRRSRWAATRTCS